MKYAIKKKSSYIYFLNTITYASIFNYRTYARKIKFNGELQEEM